jgi:dihydropteroate synthase
MKSIILKNGTLIDLNEPKIMGIINLSPDSFYKDSRYSPSDEDFLTKAEKMIENGADIIDIGGYSTRPGNSKVELSEEKQRIKIGLKSLLKAFPNLIISVDTFRKEIAEMALNEGASIINDISAGKFDPYLMPFIIQHNLPYILMHIRGKQDDFHEPQNYADITTDVAKEILITANSLRKKNCTNLIIDPGFGFSKNIEQNYHLLKNLQLFEHLKFPILMGISRKSMIYKWLNISPEESLPETQALHLLGIVKKINILRVHDIIQARRIIEISKKIVAK